MEDYKAYQAIAQIKQIVHDAGLCVANEIPCGSKLKRDLNHLEELAYIVRGYYDATKNNAFACEVASIHRHVFPQIIAWKKLQSKTQVSVARCFKILYEIATHANEPQQTENQDKPISLDEALEFIPAKHKEAAKSVFERLLQDGTIKAKKNGFEWLKKPQNGLLWYFAANANVHWELKKSNGNFDWLPFVDLFGVKSARFIEWQSKTQ
ncbi:MAG: hypothetical protein ACI30M_04305, partial [Muribaculaceae bacterium]